MRTAALLLLVGLGGCTRAVDVVHTVVPLRPAWFTLARSSHATVAVERALYERPGDPHFYVHVQVLNTTHADVAVDLQSYWSVFRVNQWTASSLDHRTAIDERRMMLGPFDPAARAKLLADERAGLLTRIPAGASVDYYDEFNAGGRAQVDAQAAGQKFVLLVMDGELRVTDGVDTERIDPPTDDAQREVAIPTPIVWKKVPGAASVLVD